MAYIGTNVGSLLPGGVNQTRMIGAGQLPKHAEQVSGRESCEPDHASFAALRHLTEDGLKARLSEQVDAAAAQKP